MDQIVSCSKLLIPIILISISFKTEDQVVAQITAMVGITVFLFSFLFLALWIKLIIVALLYLAWRLMGDNMITFFYRKFNK